jgi:hypothetical protein
MVEYSINFENFKKFIIKNGLLGLLNFQELFECLGGFSCCKNEYFFFQIFISQEKTKYHGRVFWGENLGDSGTELLLDEMSLLPLFREENAQSKF